MQYPEHSYSSDIYYIAHKDKEEEHYYEIAENHNKITIITTKSSSAELAILNKSTFYICPVCGYSGLLKKNNVPFVHKNLSGNRCEGKLVEGIDNHVNKNAIGQIGHKFYTDAIILEFPSCDISFGREIEGAKPITSQAISILYALIEGISRALHINRRELDGSLYYYKKENGIGNFSFVIFDSTPGGAGYVTQLTKNETVLSDVLKEMYDFVVNCPGEDCKQNTSCYSCMRNYDNQLYHEMLKRNKVIDFLENLGYRDETDNMYHFDIVKIENPKNQTSYSLETTNSCNSSNDDVLLIKEKAKELLREDLNIVEILEELNDSVELGDKDISFIELIKKEANIRNLEKPYHLGKIEIGNQDISYTLAWEKSKILYFNEEQYENFRKAKEYNTEWLICCTKCDDFKSNEIIASIEER